MEKLDKIVTEDRSSKYSNAPIVTITVILKFYNVPYKPSKYLFNNHTKFTELLNITHIPDFRTLSYRSLKIDWYYINSAIIDIINPENDNAAIYLSGFKITLRGDYLGDKWHKKRRG
jgi:hypothetical protein